MEIVSTLWIIYEIGFIANFGIWMAIDCFREEKTYFFAKIAVSAMWPLSFPFLVLWCKGMK